MLRVKLFPQFDPCRQLFARIVNSQTESDEVLRGWEGVSFNRLDFKRPQDSSSPNNKLVLSKPSSRTLLISKATSIQGPDDSLHQTESNYA